MLWGRSFEGKLQNFLAKARRSPEHSTQMEEKGRFSVRGNNGVAYNIPPPLEDFPTDRPFQVLYAQNVSACLEKSTHAGIPLSAGEGESGSALAEYDGCAHLPVIPLYEEPRQCG